MRFSQYLASSAVIALMFSTSAFAKDNRSGKFTLSDTVQLGSATLQPGDYKAEWSGAAPNVKVDIVQNGKIVATTFANIKNLPQPAPYTAVVIETRPDNTKKVEEIDFDHRGEALVISGE